MMSETEELVSSNYWIATASGLTRSAATLPEEISRAKWKNRTWPKLHTASDRSTVCQSFNEGGTSHTSDA
ncbi:hypothetical protein PM082_009251 [Marasmius tenuissimus]|nr:hypothetical protein PM082_009251 [Marasmius tenuissimus]